MDQKYYTYVLLSVSKKKLYIGQTHDLETRVAVHNLGISPYTKGKGPWKLVYYEEFSSRSEAMVRERYFKTGKGREFLRTKFDTS